MLFSRPRPNSMLDSFTHAGILALAGPTSSGKSAVAAHLARSCAAEVVNLDPYQAFAGLEILSAQPNEAERSLARHHLYGVLDPAEERDAASFAKLAHECVAEIRARGRKVVLVSGSGLYLRAFGGGLDLGLPPPNAELRARLEARSLDDQLEELHQLDPVEWERIDRRNPRRVTRALEICLLSGQPASSLRTGSAPKIPGPTSVCLWPEPETLKARIRERTARMFGPALKQEIASLESKTLGRSAASTLGLSTARAWQVGQLRTDQAIDEISTRTWQYARRQRTWFKRAVEFQPLEVGPQDTPEELSLRIRESVEW